MSKPRETCSRQTDLDQIVKPVCTGLVGKFPWKPSYDVKPSGFRGGVNGFVKELLSSYWRKQGAFGKEIGRIASA